MKKKEFSFTRGIKNCKIRWRFYFQNLFFICLFFLPAQGFQSKTLHPIVQSKEAKDLYRNVAIEICNEGLVLPPPYYAASKGQSHRLISVPSFNEKLFKKTLMISMSTYVTWRIWHHFWHLWPDMPEMFYNQMETVVENQNGHLDHVPIIQSAFTEFLNSPPQRRIVKHKISHILANSHQYFEQLEMFYFSPFKWIELLDKETTTILTQSNRPQTYLRSREVEILVQEFDQYYVDFKTYCGETLTLFTIDKFKYTEDQDTRDHILEFYNNPLHNLPENFQGDQDLFNFLLKKLMFQFWCGAWLMNFEVEV